MDQYISKLLSDHYITFLDFLIIRLNCSKGFLYYVRRYLESFMYKKIILRSRFHNLLYTYPIINDYYDKDY
jgi:hypothetical protein